jgi:hypothetical protein
VLGQDGVLIFHSRKRIKRKKKLTEVRIKVQSTKNKEHRKQDKRIKVNK